MSNLSNHRLAAPTFPVAGLDRRFYAFVLDRLIGWGLVAAAVWAAYELFFRDDEAWPGIALVAGAVLLVWLVFGVALGVTGATPGKAAAGLRAVHDGTGTPVGVGRALLRGAVLGVATLLTFGIGLATLAWTAVADPGHRRRGWHDRLARSVVVDVRPPPESVEPADSGPRHVVNLTAMRLVPAPAPPAPSPTPRPAPEPLVTPAPSGGSHRTVRRAPVLAPSAPPTGWVLGFDTGERVVLEGLVLLGRRPEGRPGEVVHHLVALPSADMSLSKTHAQVGVAPDGALVVMDRGSTNGSVLVRHGVKRPLSGGRPTTLLEGDLVRFGDRSMRVSRESFPD